MPERLMTRLVACLNDAAGPVERLRHEVTARPWAPTVVRAVRPHGMKSRISAATKAAPSPIAEMVFSVYQTASYIAGIGPIRGTSMYAYTSTAARPAPATTAATAAVQRLGWKSSSSAARIDTTASARNRSPWLSVLVFTGE